MFKNKNWLVITAFICLTSALQAKSFDAKDLLNHCKTIGMTDDDVRVFLQNPDLSAIKKLYIAASMKSHPDTGGSKEAFQILGKAKECLIQYANQSHRVRDYSSSMTSGTYPHTTYASGFGPNGYRPIVAFKVGILGVMGTGFCYGLYTLKNRPDQVREQEEETQRHAPQAALKSVAINSSNEQLQMICGLGAAVAFGMIVYKAYNYYYRNDNQSTRERTRDKELRSQSK